MRLDWRNGRKTILEIRLVYPDFGQRLRFNAINSSACLRVATIVAVINCIRRHMLASKDCCTQTPIMAHCRELQGIQKSDSTHGVSNCELTADSPDMQTHVAPRIVTSFARLILVGAADDCDFLAASSASRIASSSGVLSWVVMQLRSIFRLGCQRATDERKRMS